jgi:quercetin dioxygenase-like cupin family protein
MWIEVAVISALLHVPLDTLPAADITQADLQQLVDRVVAEGRTTDVPIRTIEAGGHHVGVGLVYRPTGATGGSASHDLVSEVYHILEGAGTLVTGGTMLEPRRRDGASTLVVQVNGPGWSGAEIEGGVSRRVEKGDVVIIPAATPHWWREVESALVYTVVRVDPNNVVTLR